MLKVTPKVTRLINYIRDIEEGKLQIPTFQRDFVWGKKEKLDLFESLKLGYPIGSLLFWKPTDTFFVKEEIGPYRVPARVQNEQYLYILDGFQRLSTLFGCLINPDNTELQRNEAERAKEFAIYYDLIAEEFTFSRSATTDITFIPVNTLIDTYAFLDYGERLRSTLTDRGFASELIDRARTLSSSILDYELPSIEIVGGSIEDAVDIFSRINSKGAKISPDWMVSALTYNQEHNFRLGTEIDRLIFQLKEYNFEKIKRELVLQCIQSAFGKYYFDEKVAGLVKKSNFISVAIRTLNSIVKAVAFLFEELLVIDSKLLPYNSQLIFLTYFFNEVPQPSHFQLKKLKYWFWVTTYSGYFTIYSLSKQRLAFNQFKEFITDPDVDMIFNDKPGTPFIVSEFPKTIYFGSVRAKALVLFLLNKGNDFTPVNTANVDELKIYYLLENQQIPEGVVPMISYTPDQSDAEVVQTKHRDLSYMFDSPDFPEYAERFLLSDQMRNQYQLGDFQGILLSRKDLMLYHESQFVQSLGLVY